MRRRLINTYLLTGKRGIATGRILGFPLCSSVTLTLAKIISLIGMLMTCAHGGRRPPLESFADRGDEDFSPMRCPAVFKQGNALPGSELHFSVGNRHRFACAG